jgi:hypothetical protein
MLPMVLPSHAGDITATQDCTGCGKVVQPPISEHRGVVAAWRSRIDMIIVDDICVGS